MHICLGRAGGGDGVSCCSCFCFNNKPCCTCSRTAGQPFSVLAAHYHLIYFIYFILFFFGFSAKYLILQPPCQLCTPLSRLGPSTSAAVYLLPRLLQPLRSPRPPPPHHCRRLIPAPLLWATPLPFPDGVRLERRGYICVHCVAGLGRFYGSWIE